VLPAALGPPFGATIMDLPARFPLPAKIAIRVGKPIDLRQCLGQQPDPDKGYKLVHFDHAADADPTLEPALASGHWVSAGSTVPNRSKP